MALLPLELLWAGWELVIAVLPWVMVWVDMVTCGVRKGLSGCFMFVGDALRDCAIGVKQIC